MLKAPLNRPKLMHKMRVLQGILLSLLIHFFLMWSAQFAPLVADKLNTESISVEILDEESQNETDKKLIVRDAQIPEKLKVHDSQDPLSFLSADRQRVKKQTQAATTGMTKNRNGEKAAKEVTRQTPEQNNKSSQSLVQTDPRLPGNLEAFTPKYRKAPSLPQEVDLERGLSTVGEALPKDVAVGSFTALNTDRLTYYSFFARIEEMIRFRWESSVRTAIDSTAGARLLGNPSGVWVTQMEVWLKPNGEVHSTHIMKEAGFRRFDLAATQAFQQARMFPNPPQEMVESDGLIRLKYSFQVRYEPKVVVKSSD